MITTGMLYAIPMHLYRVVADFLVLRQFAPSHPLLSSPCFCLALVNSLVACLAGSGSDSSLVDSLFSWLWFRWFLGSLFLTLN